MIAGDLPDLPNYVATGSIRVHAPTYVIFLCGGDVQPASPHPISLRDALIRISHRSILAKYDVRRAEEMEWAFPLGEYTQLLMFESDIAQISNLIVLFSESPGSLAELGSFVKDDEIARRMVVFVDSKNYKNPSFIKLGPLQYLMDTYDETFVSVLQLSDLNIDDIRDLRNIDLNKFLEATDGPLHHHLRRKLEPRTFDPSRHGHVTKLITGLIQHYAALTIVEIDVLLYCLGVPIPEQEIKKHLNCAELFGWVFREKVGIQTYYAAIVGNRALYFDVPPNSERLDRSRWTSTILDYWEHFEPERFSSIQRAIARARR